MPIDPEKLLAWEFPEVEQTYSERDSMLYALGVGLGADPLDGEQLRFVYEKDLHVLPTQAVVLCRPPNFSRDPASGISPGMTVHGEQVMRLHRPLPAAATVTARTRITGVVDKGAGRGALIYSEREVVLKESGEKLVSLEATSFARGDGGFGGPAGPVRELHRLPEEPPAMVCDLDTIPQAALIYRLSGDYNPLHSDPEVAARVGFRAPILHGACTYGITGHALLKTLCGYDPARLLSMAARFSSPVYPGETIRTEMWPSGGVVGFRARVVARDVVVLDNGRAEIAV